MSKLTKKNTKKFSKIINYTIHDLMRRNKKVICFGLGINDPKGIFGTTLNLKKNLDQTEFLIYLFLRMR